MSARAPPERATSAQIRLDCAPLRGARSLAWAPAGTEVSAQLLYRSVETGVYGNIQSFASGTFSDDCRLSVTLVLE